MGLGMASLGPLLSTSALWLQRYLGWEVGVFGQLLLTSNLVMMLGVALTFEKLTTRSHRQHLHLTSPTSRTAAASPPRAQVRARTDRSRRGAGGVRHQSGMDKRH